MSGPVRPDCCTFVRSYATWFRDNGGGGGSVCTGIARLGPLPSLPLSLSRSLAPRYLATIPVSYARMH